MPRVKQKCWTVNVQERDLFDASGFDLLAILRIEGESREEAEQKALSWWRANRAIVLPHHSHRDFRCDVPDVPFIIVTP